MHYQFITSETLRKEVHLCFYKRFEMRDHKVDDLTFPIHIVRRCYPLSNLAFNTKDLSTSRDALYVTRTNIKNVHNCLLDTMQMCSV